MAARQIADTRQREQPADGPARAATASPRASTWGAFAHPAHGDVVERQICIAVDDFGLHDGINGAALRLVSMGRVQAIGCMVGGAAWANGSRALRSQALEDTDLGLHLDLTESPLLPGTARPLGALVRDAYLRRLDRRAVGAEIRAQLDAFERSLHRRPAYVDGHQHVHQLPIVRGELIDELAHRYGWRRPWLRCTRRPRGLDGALPQGWRARLKPLVIETLGCRGLLALARHSGYMHNARLLGVYDFQGGPARYAQLLAAWLQAARTGDLLMCHPSLPIDGTDPMIAARCAEFSVLAGAELESQIATAGIELRPMSRILESIPASAL